MRHRRRTIDLDGATISYTDTGSGPPLVLLHGAPTTSFVYRHVIEHLRGSFRCIAPDFPGWGDSPPLRGREPTLPALADVAERFVEALGLEDTVLAVMDTAGAPGMRVVQRRPEQFAGLVLAGTFVFPVGEYPLVRRMLSLATGRLFAAANRRFNLLPRIVARFGGRGRKLTPEECLAYDHAFPSWESRDRVLIPLRDLRDNSAFVGTVARELSGVALPALLLFGENDPVRRVGVQDRLAAMLSNATSVVIPDEAHFPQEGDPESVAGAILGWAAGAGILSKDREMSAC